jgi:hypothetical protein
MQTRKQQEVVLIGVGAEAAACYKLEAGRRQETAERGVLMQELG